jgi:glucosamine-6-phosphate deaminase
MPIEVVRDAAALARRAAEIICETARAKPNAVIGLPSGDTPRATYALLALRAEQGDCELGRVTVFAVDEFADARRDTPGTNSMYFRNEVNVPVRTLHVPNPSARDPDEHVRAFAESVRRAGGFDLCVLGIGVNGHIAFNEPGSGADSRARVVELTESSREAHAAAFGSLDAVRARGLTLGVADLLESRAILVLAQGERKAAVVAAAIEGPATADVPASWLQHHADVTWLLDEAAAARITRR